jgi:uncharacterized protein YbcI
MSRPSGETPPAGAQASAISNATVRVMSEYTGRGPTKARTYITGDLVSVVLQDTLTKGERTLVSSGQRELVLSTRKAHQDTMSTVLIASVEDITGRDVVAFLSSNHIDPDYAVESFVLAPALDHPESEGGDEAADSEGGDGGQDPQQD